MSDMTAVIGAGVMGSGIAQAAAIAGEPVVLFDPVAGVARAAVDRIAKEQKARVDRGKISFEEADAIVSRIEATDDIGRVAGADLIIEAVPETIGLKDEVFAAVSAIAADDAILATNTSSLSIDRIARNVPNPGRVLGLHFFNPAQIMKLVEIVPALATEDAIVLRSEARMRSWGKSPVRTANHPGFIVNRVARPYYAQAFELWETGAAEPEQIDRLLEASGLFPMGPFALTDLIGQDVNAAVTETVFQAFGHDARYRPSRRQRQLVDAGWLGRKAERGVYTYPRAPIAKPAKWAPRHDRISTWLPTAKSGGSTSIAGGRLRITDGRSAQVVAKQTGQPDSAVLDWSLEAPGPVDRAVTFAATASDAFRQAVLGALTDAGLCPVFLADSPGLVVARTVALIMNEALETETAGTATAADIDHAMRLGAGYRADLSTVRKHIGADALLNVIDALHDAYRSERFRAAYALRVQAAADASARTEAAPAISA